MMSTSSFFCQMLIFMLQIDPDEDNSFGDEQFLSRQLEAQVGLKKNLTIKYEKAKDAYEKARKKKLQKDAADKVDAYNAWRIAEEKKGRTQDEHGKNLVKIMTDLVKAKSPREPVTESMCNVIGNVDGMLHFFHIFFLHIKVRIIYINMRFFLCFLKEILGGYEEHL